MKKLGLKKEFLIITLIATLMLMISTSVFAAGEIPSLIDDAFGAVSYTITFDANGGTGTMTAVSKNSNETYTLPTSTFTAPTGKQFASWDVNGPEKKVGDVITITANTTVKAVWKDVTAATPITSTQPTTNTTVSTYNNDTKLPQTGDASDYAIFAVIAIVAVVAVVAYKKSRDYSNL